MALGLDIMSIIGAIEGSGGACQPDRARYVVPARSPIGRDLDNLVGNTPFEATRSSRSAAIGWR